MCKTSIIVEMVQFNHKVIKYCLILIYFTTSLIKTSQNGNYFDQIYHLIRLLVNKILVWFVNIAQVSLVKT